MAGNGSTGCDVTDGDATKLGLPPLPCSAVAARDAEGSGLEDAAPMNVVSFKLETLFKLRTCDMPHW